MDKMNKRAVGSVYEQSAARFLKDKGYSILEMNFRCRFGEIDIIAKDGSVLVFAEVKYRASSGSGFPSEAVNYRKQSTICKVADRYMLKHGLYDNTPCRFDIISVLGDEIRHIENAFEYIGCAR